MENENTTQSTPAGIDIETAAGLGFDAGIAYQRSVDGARDISIPDKETFIKNLFVE